MPEDPLDRCLVLCRQALECGGTAQLQVLSDLHKQLGLLRPALRMAESCPAPEITMDLAGYLTGWNEGAERLFGYAREEALGRHVLFLYADDDNAGEVAELFLEPGTSLIEVRRRKKSGEIFWAGLSLSLIRDEYGLPVGMTARLSEIADRLSPEDKLRLHARIIEQSDQGILITDPQERIVSVNAAFTRITGYSAAEAIGKTPDLLRSGLHDADFRAEVRAAMRGSGPWHGEIYGRRKNGEIFPQSVTISVVRDDNGEITHAFSIFTDISAYKEAEARMLRMANYDTLTNLPNRTLLVQLTDQALTAARRSKAHGALLVIAFDRLDAYYDTLGHEVGDMLLREISQRLRHALRDEDVLARIDSRKLAVALFEIRKREHAGLVAQKLGNALEAPFIIGPHEVHVSAAIGIAIYPEDAANCASLLRHADIALARLQKERSAGYMYFSAEMNRRVQENLQMESELRRALAGGQLQLHYQPKVSLRNGRIVGAEALLRWQHPRNGPVPPATFVQVAEETGLIFDLGDWVLEETCRQIRAWQDQGVSVPPIAINLSTRQFRPDLPGKIQAVLERHGVTPEYLKLEITETLLADGPDTVVPIMNQLVAMGLALALDDFGTGYSSLSYLKKFPISTLKIDRTFVVGLPREESDCVIARAIVTMGRQLRQEIVAEGVETLEQMQFLREIGCDQLQGYLFSRPVDADEFAGMLREGRRLAVT